MKNKYEKISMISVRDWMEHGSVSRMGDRTVDGFVLLPQFHIYSFISALFSLSLSLCWFCVCSFGIDYQVPWPAAPDSPWRRRFVYRRSLTGHMTHT